MIMKRFTATILSLGILLYIGVIPAFAANAIDEARGKTGVAQEFQELEELCSDEFCITQAESIKVYNQLLQNMRESVSLYSSRIYGEYPDYYGGAYIDDQTGELVILVTDLSAITQNAIATFAEDSPQIRVQRCSIPYNHILDAIETVSENLQYFDDQGVHIDSIRDDIINNRVIINVQGLNPSKITIIKELADYDFLVFENSEGIVLDSTSRSGGKIFNVDTNMSSTLGFAAEREGVSGFVVAGHTAQENAVFATDDMNETKLGVTKESAWKNKSKADAAFVQAYNGITISNSLPGAGDIWGATTYEVPAGTTVYMYGAMSGYLKSGQIISISQTQNVGGLTISKQMVANYSAVGGDSGAPVMIYDGTFNGPKYTLIGIHSAHLKNGSSQIDYFSPYQNIVDELGITFVED